MSLYDEQNLRKMIRELLNIEDGLTDWKMGFLDNVSSRSGPLSDKQAAVIERIWERIFK